MSERLGVVVEEKPRLCDAKAYTVRPGRRYFECEGPLGHEGPHLDPAYGVMWEYVDKTLVSTPIWRGLA